MTANELAEKIQQGDRRALSKGITLLESTKATDRIVANELLLELSHLESLNTIRLGVSGVPGAGKSTFIESLGMHLVKDRDLNVAVLAVDPSSPISGGSIMGDKTRMEKLSQLESAFIRPSPTKGKMGGVNIATRESMLLCEAAGFDVIIIETVGVGQSEYLVRNLVDVFLLLTVPNSGDELQGIKKGIMELADIIAVNKEDLNTSAVQLSVKQTESALSIIKTSSFWTPKVIALSATDPKKVKAAWKLLYEYITLLHTEENFERQRKHQSLTWLQEKVENLILDRIRSSDRYSLQLQEAQKNINSNGSKVVKEAMAISEEWMQNVQ